MDLNSNITILSRRDQITTITTVQMVIDGQTIEIDVAHFMPTCEDDINNGLNNRYITEQANLENGG